MRLVPRRRRAAQARSRDGGDGVPDRRPNELIPAPGRARGDPGPRALGDEATRDLADGIGDDRRPWARRSAGAGR